MKSSSLTLALVALLLVPVGLVLWFALRPSERSRGAAIAAGSPERTSAPAGPAELLRASGIELPARAFREPGADPRPSPSSRPDLARACVVVGRVADEHHRPLPGVAVDLSGYRGWAEGHDVPPLTGRYAGNGLHGWEVRTDASGAFRFEVPVPTVAAPQLLIASEPFLDFAQLVFDGGQEAQSRARLRAGQNDCGELLLVATGAIRGRVVDAEGRPVPGANLHLAEGLEGFLDHPPSVSDLRGLYTLEHLAAGAYGITVLCDGYLSEFHGSFLVEVGHFTDADLVLRPAPTLCGVIVDEDGRGIEGARLLALPPSGICATGASAADGGFSLPLAVATSYRIQAEREGYDSYGLDGSSPRYAPGSADIRIVLRRSMSPRTRFVVVDAATRAPIRRFGIEIERERGSASARSSSTIPRARPAPASHPEGELELDARPGLDRYTVQAPGYLRRFGDVQHVAPDDPRQVVELIPGGTLTGRIVDAGVPVEGASVQLQPLHARSDIGALAFQMDPSGSSQALTDAEGRFRFEMLGEGTFSLVARAADGRCVERMPLEFPSAGDLDLGALVVGPGATILGQVLLPGGRSAAGLGVRLEQGEATRVTDAEGRFRFDGLLPGTFQVFVDAAPGVLERISAGVTLAAGEVREVVLDARESGTCAVTLGIELGGRAATGLAIALIPVGDEDAHYELGTTDTAGRVSGFAPALDSARVELVLAGGTRLVHPHPLGPLDVDGSFEAVVRFEIGRLVIELPSSLALPARGWASLVLVPQDDAAGRSSRKLVLPAESTASDLVLDGRSIRCENVLPGEYELVFAITDAAAPLESVPIAGGSRMERPSLYRSSARVVVTPTETTRVVLR